MKDKHMNLRRMDLILLHFQNVDVPDSKGDLHNQPPFARYSISNPVGAPPKH